MTCERCRHELEPAGYAQVWCEHEVTKCIANLRADLAFLRAAKDGRDAEFAQALADLEAEHERANEAEAQCAAMRAAAEAGLVLAGVWDDSHPVKRRIREALAADPGDLLTAVRRLVEVARDVAFDSGALRDALADPALAALRGAPP